MVRLKKYCLVIQRSIIKKYVYINTDLFIRKYTAFLKKIGIIFTGATGKIKYIEPSVYFDGTDYSLIHIGDNVTISREVMILTHDYSINAALCSLGIRIDRHQGEYHFRRTVKIGDNTFIGARVSLLGGADIGKNCIIGACAVVKGKIPDGSIVIGNPAKIIGRTEDYARKHQKLRDFEIEM